MTDHAERVNYADRKFSTLIRAMANWTCETCGAQPEDRGELHCSHYKSRRHLATRWMPTNAICQCWRCHGQYELDKAELRKVFVRKYGDAHIDIVDREAVKTKTVSREQHIEDAMELIRTLSKRLKQLAG